MPVIKWQRCTGTELELPPMQNIRKVALNRHFPVYADWKRRVMMTSCSTAWGRCCIQEPVQEKMTE